jgi:hypothetical protein
VIGPESIILAGFWIPFKVYITFDDEVTLGTRLNILEGPCLTFVILSVPRQPNAVPLPMKQSGALIRESLSGCSSSTTLSNYDHIRRHFLIIHT